MNSEKYRQIKIKGRHVVSNQITIHQLFAETGGSDFGLPKLVRNIFQMWSSVANI
jgi:hypothetical protein